MKNLIKLQLRKSLLTFTVLLGAVLAAVPLALLVKSKAISAREAVNLAMFYWAAAGIPLVTLILSGIAGSEAAREQARSVEQPLPVSQYRLLLSSLTTVLLQLGALGLVIAAIMGFGLPLETLTKIQQEVLRFYLFAVIYLALFGFTLSYAFRNGIAGGALAVAAVSATLLPLIDMGEFQQLSFEIVPLWLIKPAIAALALACGALALKQLSRIGDRKAKRTAVNISLTVLLVAAPVLASFATLAWFNLQGRKVTLPVTKMFGAFYGTDNSLYSSRARRETAGRVLVQKPFSGEVFFVDKDGNRSMIEPAGPEAGLLSMPNLSLAYGEAIGGPAGEVWVLYSKMGRGRVLGGSMKTGFTTLRAVGSIWSSSLIAGNEPGLLERSENDYYYSPLSGKNALERKKVSFRKEGYMRFLGEKHLREGAAAVFGKGGKTLEYRGKRWSIPGVEAWQLPEPGVELADGMNFLVPLKTKDGYATWLCRPNGKAEMIWPEYFRLMQNLKAAPDGTVWGKKETRMLSKFKIALGGYSRLAQEAPLFYILTSDSKPLSGVKADQVVEKAGVDGGEIDLVHSAGDNLWFVSGSRYLVRTDQKGAGEVKVWKLPSVIRNRIKQVQASADGVFTAAADGVYFTDWEGKTRQIY